jgi:hypothetical protein
VVKIDVFNLSIRVVRKGLYLQTCKEFPFDMPLMTCRSLYKKVVNGIDLHVKLS